MDIKIKNFFMYIILLFIILVTSLIIAEVFNYVSSPNEDQYYVWSPDTEYFFYPNASAFYGIYGDSIFTINKLGYRGKEFRNRDSEYRILITGGSTSECLYLDDKETWSYLLMNDLEKTRDNKKVITMNIAKSGHGVRNNILALKYLPENYDPDLIVVMAGANDLLFRLSRGNGFHLFNESEYDNTEDYTFSQYPRYTVKSTITYKLFKSLELYFEENNQDPQGETLVENRLKRKYAESWIIKKPDLTLALEDYEKNLKRVVELSKEANTTLILVTQPYLWKENMTQGENASLWMTYDFGDNYYPIENMIYGMDAFNERLLKVCKDEKIHCIDLEKDIPKNLDYFYDDMHFNEKGADLVAEKISNYIEKNILQFL